jgi:hypothetical protein
MEVESLSTNGGPRQGLTPISSWHESNKRGRPLGQYVSLSWPKGDQSPFAGRRSAGWLLAIGEMRHEDSRIITQVANVFPGILGSGSFVCEVKGGYTVDVEVEGKTRK